MSELTTIHEEAAVVPPPTAVKVADVAKARFELAGFKKRILELEAELANTPPAILLSKVREEAKIAAMYAEELETDYRAQMLEAFQATGEKQQPGGVVKMFKKLDYDTDLAVDWSIKHGHAQLLKLNATAFEKVAKELTLEFVVATEEPRATLASDLSEFLEGE